MQTIKKIFRLRRPARKTSLTSRALAQLAFLCGYFRKEKGYAFQVATTFWDYPKRGCNFTGRAATEIFLFIIGGCALFALHFNKAHPTILHF